MSVHSPVSLTPSLVSEYKAVLTRRDPDDWDGHRERVDTAHRLARRAFVDHERAAWEIVQLIAWRLQRRNNLRPTEPGDVHVLDTIYRVDEAAAPPQPPLPEMSPGEFLERLDRDCASWSAVDTPMLRFIQSGDFSIEDLRYWTYQAMLPSRDFIREIAITIPLFSTEQLVPVVANLYDEAGQCEAGQAHPILIRRFADHVGVDASDDEGILDWVVPDMVASATATHRHLWHSDVAWTLGSMLCIERVLPDVLGMMVEGLTKANVPPEVFIHFKIHAETDSQHADDWLAVVGQCLQTHAERQNAHRAAMERGYWELKGWQVIWEGLQKWRSTGHALRLPARELREATGM